MSSSSLVRCPGCGHRRNLKSITRDPEGKGEVRTFHCPECDDTMRYLLRGRGEPIVIPAKPSRK